jgi:protein-tyrosine phosphatase
MIDWHSHILPKMDDGSRSVEESVCMLDSLKTQGVSLAIATPHFCADEESIDAFLQRRAASYQMLSQSINSSHPHVLCGAEVKYYPGISKMQHLELLAAENTNVLLLEMPMAKWTEYAIKELVELAGTRGLTIVMAHIERYSAMQSRGTVEWLCANGLLMQVNASFFERVGTRRRALRLLDRGMIHLIGSDCHNLTSRPPRLNVAYELIEKRRGTDYVLQMNEFGHRALKYKETI